MFKPTLLLLSLNLALGTPEQYAKKEHIETKAEKVGENLYFTFGFNDDKGRYNTWKWSDNLEQLDNLAQAFGLYNKDADNFRYLPEELPAGLFKEHFDVGVLPDYSALISYYYKTATPIFHKWQKLIVSENLSKRASIESLLRFFQDYPYGIPPAIMNDRFIGGLFVPPLIFKNGFADCDSKSLLMAMVLAHDEYFKDKLAMILVPGHALLGVEIPALVYDQFYTYRNRKYVVAEPTGLARTPLGRKNSPYDKLVKLIPLEVDIEIASEKSLEQTKEAGSEIKELVQADCPDNGLLVDYVSPTLNLRIQVCQIKKAGTFLKHGPEVIFDSANKPKTKNIYRNNEKI